jgi:hypothetical protein
MEMFPLELFYSEPASPRSAKVNLHAGDSILKNALALQNFFFLVDRPQHRCSKFTHFLKVPKCEIFYLSDFPDFYTIKSLLEILFVPF